MKRKKTRRRLLVAGVLLLALLGLSWEHLFPPAIPPVAVAAPLSVPTGRLLVMSAGRFALLDPAGGEPVPISDPLEGNVMPARLSPDRTRVAFIRGEWDGHRRPFVHTVGSVEIMLPGGAMNVGWAGDGRLGLFGYVKRGPGQYDSVVNIFDPKTGRVDRLPLPAGLFTATGSAWDWFPNSTAMLASRSNPGWFAAENSVGFERVDVPTGDRDWLTGPTDSDYQGRVSPDGKRILFGRALSSRWREKLPHQVHVAEVGDPDSARLLPLTLEAGEGVNGWCWSPDGNWVAVAIHTMSQQRVVIVTPDGHGQRTLRTEANPARGCAHWLDWR